MSQRIARAGRLAALLLLCAAALTGCPDGGDGSSWSISIRGDTNTGSAPGGFHASFEWHF